MKLLASAVAAAFLLAPGVARACAPPIIPCAPGSLRLDASDLHQIADVASMFRHAPRRARVQLSVGTDIVGSSMVNRRMAQRRGEVIKAALIRRGVPARAIALEIYDPRPGSGTERLAFIELVEAPFACG